MKKTLEIIVTILFGVIIPFFIGLGVRTYYDNKLSEQKYSDVSDILNKNKDRFTDCIIDMAKVNPAEPSYDSRLNENLCKSYVIWQDTYNLIREKQLLYKDSSMFSEANQLLTSIYNWQLEKEKTRVNVLSGSGVTSIFTIEADLEHQLATDMTILACTEVLKIDPDNEDAKNTLTLINKQK